MEICLQMQALWGEIQKGRVEIWLKNAGAGFFFLLALWQVLVSSFPCSLSDRERGAADPATGNSTAAFFCCRLSFKTFLSSPPAFLLWTGEVYSDRIGQIKFYNC